MNRVPRRIVACVICAVIVALGLWLFMANTRSDAQIQAEAATRAAESYTPTCDGKAMEPGDVCMRFGKGASTQTYTEMVDQHDQEGSPQALRSNHTHWQVFGLIVAGVGALALALAVFALVLVIRTTRGRQAFAQSRGWSFQRSDPDLLSRLSSLEVRSPRSEASCVIAGSHGGYPFLLYDFLDASASNTKNTMFVLILPQSMPYLVLKAAGTDRVSTSTSPAGRQLYTPEVDGLVRSRGLGWIVVNGNGLRYKWGGWFSPKPAAIIERLDALTQFAAALSRAGQAMPGTPPPATPAA